MGCNNVYIFSAHHSVTIFKFAVKSLIFELRNSCLTLVQQLVFCQWTAWFNIQRKPDECYVYLEISLLDCLTTKKIQDFSKISEKIPGLSRTGGNHELSGPPSRAIHLLFWHMLTIKPPSIYDSFISVSSLLLKFQESYLGGLQIILRIRGLVSGKIISIEIFLISFGKKVFL